MIYEAPLDCLPETDICKLDRERDRGPFVYKGKLYVPVRPAAEAFGLHVQAQKAENGSTIIFAES
ncbi:hypothetical protein QWJ34_20815 [Saccharibacillus sp. CPCC 101409]|uniref:stalk domain-containing protein n=1 Tax=Saccharibacillus sp. CPCC 101409 TaxID=3058041 RepID=UPI0026727662|nr:hypothetical protein [Saccharibacillus sp. CPCC 101409]MDO3412218.1 hypothetical protein [Saccharibacillus sp. CPCC 101409]